MSLFTLLTRYQQDLTYRLAASWHHPRFGIRFYKGRIVQVYGQVNPRFLRALKDFKGLEDISQGWIMGIPTQRDTRSLKLLGSALFSEGLLQRLRNLLQSSV